MAALATGIRSVYQPIVRLADRRVIAYEALARGPAGSPLEMPDAALRHGAAARASRRPSTGSAGGRRCAAACRAGSAPSGRSSSTSSPPRPPPGCRRSATRCWRKRWSRFPLVVELTERALPNHTTDLIPLAEDLRRRGARIALDDVGTDPRSLALMPFLRPDVIKLDLN